MTDAEKLTRVKLILGISGTDEDTLLSGYLDLARDAIIDHLCSLYTPVGGMSDVPQKYDQVQVMAVVAGYNLIGAENETVHIENGIDRHYKYSDMLAYIENHVIPYARIV